MTAVAVAPPRRGVRVAAGVMTWFVVLFMLFSTSFKFLPVDVAEGFAHLGLPLSLCPMLGVLELSCTLLYALPRTRAIGAILLTGYLGGAIVTHWRVGDPLPTHTLFPVWIGAIAWAGVLLRDSALREALLAPLRRGALTR